MDSNWKLIADFALGVDPRGINLKDGDLVGYRWIATAPGRGRGRPHFVLRQVEDPDLRLDVVPLEPHDPRYEIVEDGLPTGEPIRSFQQQDGDLLIYRHEENPLRRIELLRVERLRTGEVEQIPKGRQIRLLKGDVVLPGLDTLKQITDRQDDRQQQIAELRSYAKEYRRTGELPRELGDRLDHWADLLEER